MRVTLVLPDGLGLGGVTTWSIEMANRLAARNREVTLIEHVSEQNSPPEVIRPGVRVIKHYGQMPAYAQFHDVARYVKSYQQALPGIMIPNYEAGTFAACALLSHQAAGRMRVIALAHSDEDYYYNLLHYYEPIIHGFVAVSREVAHSLAQRIPHRAEDMITRPYGVHTPPGLQRTWTPLGQPLKLMYAGRLVEKQKRVSDLARLVAILRANAVDFQLEIVGDGADKERLTANIATLVASDPSLRGRVCLSGRLSHAQTLKSWQMADVCVLVSEYEGTSIAMLEAMAAGCVPVVTGVSGAVGAITPGINGYLVEVGDLDGMAKIIQRLAADRLHLANLGQHAYQTARSVFSVDAYVDWFLSLTERIAAQPARSWPSGKPVLPPQPRVSWVRRTGRRGKRALRRLWAIIEQR
jgi:glycosyltransferase involved in cell wall biosynthesis